MRIETTRFGPLEIDPQKIIHFPFGLLGFSAIKDYVILDHDQDVPFKWLQAVTEPDLAFVIMDPLLLLPDYEVDISRQDLEDLRVNDVHNLTLFVIVSVPPGEPLQMTANLKGPVLVNEENRWAKQLVLVDRSYPTRYPLFTAQA
ncbi:MAG: flagellar assembly protein FliW [Nitrospinota bacterium]|nr:MAG: flagellar assembly protein FliW [Nitrospinota bacterium]